MALVKSIGERYLWIDTLCIVQDDETNLGYHIDRMHHIYGMSLATIVKMCGQTAGDCLPGVRPKSRAAPCNMLRTRDMVVICRHPGIDTLARESNYERRAWTFQERLLSPRCIIFSDVEVFFLCGSGSYRETLNGMGRILELPYAATLSNSLTDRDEKAKDPFEKVSRSWKTEPTSDPDLYIYGSGGVATTQPDYVQASGDRPATFGERVLPTSFANHVLRALSIGYEEQAKDPAMHQEFILGYFVAYRFLVRDFTKRCLTKPADVLRAFSGIAALLERLRKYSRYKDGMWTTYQHH